MSWAAIGICIIVGILAGWEILDEYYLIRIRSLKLERRPGARFTPASRRMVLMAISIIAAILIAKGWI